MKIKVMKSPPEIPDDEIHQTMNFDQLLRQHKAENEKKSSKSESISRGVIKKTS